MKKTGHEDEQMSVVDVALDTPLTRLERTLSSDAFAPVENLTY